MGRAKTFEELVVWQKAHQFVLQIYQFTRLFPSSETFGLSSQLRRAAVSIAANIAESFNRRTSAERVRFLSFSKGSLEECRYYLILAHDLECGDTSTPCSLLGDVSRLLQSFTSRISNR
ncbi:MAG: four helix bundle protein [Coprothermobacterota bacterium]|nr:four helix bundle protein [Coprothermobacterota bacterium]